MDTTIRNLDEKAYRALKARAALSGRSIGETLNEAIRAFLARPDGFQNTGSLRELEPQAYPEGNERLSDNVDSVAYGV
jgi:plasmid stability protein